MKPRPKEQSKSGDEDTPTQGQVPLCELFSFADGLDWFLMFVGTLMGCCTGVAVPIFMLFFGQILDDIGQGKGSLKDGVNKMASSMAALGACALVTSTLQVAFFQFTSARMTERLRNRLLKSLLRQEVGWFDRHRGGELATVLSEAATAFQEGTGRRIADGWQGAAQFGAGLIIAFSQSWQLSLVLLAGLPFIGGAAAMLTKVLADAKNKSSEQYAEAGGVASEALGSIRTVASLCSERTFLKAYDVLLEKAEAIGIKKTFAVGAANGSLYSSAFFIYALAFWYGSKLVADNLDCVMSGGSDCITGGAIITTFFSFLIGCFSLGQLAPSLKAVAVARASLVRVMAIIKRVPKLDPLADSGKNLPSVRGDIEFNVEEFAYPARPDNRVCDNYRLSVKAGETVALVGLSGGGKSTAISLLLRFYDPTKGTIMLDDVDIRDLNTKWLRSAIGFVGQEPVLFAGSIADNIRSGKPDATIAEVEDAARAANAYDFIMAFPEGFQTDVGQRGSQMSGGQKQRIAIARAIIKNPSILLLDEATSALDNESEKLVQAALDKLATMKKRTTFVVAHRLSTIRNADKIAVIVNGHVAELGTHDDLMKLGGTYAELVALQGGVRSGDATPIVSPTDGRKESLTSGAGELQLESVRLADPPNTSTLSVLTRKDSHAQRISGDRPSLWRLVLRYWPYLFVGLFAECCLGVLFPLWGYFLANVMNTFYSTDSDYIIERGSFWACMFVMLGGASVIFYTISSFGLGNVAEKLARWLRHGCFEAMLRRNIGWFDMPENTLGSLLVRLEKETQSIHKLTGDMIGRQCQVFFTLLTGLLISFSASWEIALVTLATFPVMAGANAVQMKVMLGQGTDQEGMDGGSTANGLLTSAIMAIRTVKAFSLDESIQQRYEAALAPQTSGRKSRGLVHGLVFGLTQLSLFETWALLFWFGGVMVNKGKYTFQEMMEAIMAILMGAMGLGQAFADVVDMKEARQDTEKVLDLMYSAKDLSIDSLAPGGTKLPRVDGKMEFQNIHFKYPARPELWVLGGPQNPKGFSLTVAAGKTIAFVGQSGSGKSTLVSFVLRYYDPDQGSVLIDGTDIKTMNVHNLRSHVAYVGQEPQLFRGTIADNISFGKEGATREEIVSAAKAAHAHDFITGFKDGYDTELVEGSVNLSGGQKQRIAIARAIIKDAPILLLDEATSALDNESERVVQAALDELQASASKKRTTLVIAHRLSTIRNADKIVVMRQGVVVEEGHHDQLMKLDGTYAMLARQQGLA